MLSSVAKDFRVGEHVYLALDRPINATSMASSQMGVAENETQSTYPSGWLPLNGVNFDGGDIKTCV